MEDGVFFREVLCSGKTLKVKQLYIGDVGCVVWDAALVICRFLIPFLSRKLQNAPQVPGEPTVFFLGFLEREECCGARGRDRGGWTGRWNPGVNSYNKNDAPISLYHLHTHVVVSRADVIVTDLAECVALMRSNIELNKDCITGRVTARSLVWYNVIIRAFTIILNMHPS